MNTKNILEKYAIDAIGAGVINPSYKPNSKVFKRMETGYKGTIYPNVATEFYNKSGFSPSKNEWEKNLRDIFSQAVIRTKLPAGFKFIDESTAKKYGIAIRNGYKIATPNGAFPDFGKRRTPFVYVRSN